MSLNQSPRTPIKLEDLLRLKRCERPASDYWNVFDKELRMKQLAAIVKKEAGWKSWFLGLPKLERIGFTTGALAALSLAVFYWLETTKPLTPHFAQADTQPILIKPTLAMTHEPTLEPERSEPVVSAHPAHAAVVAQLADVVPERITIPSPTSTEAIFPNQEVRTSMLAEHTSPMSNLALNEVPVLLGEVKIAAIKVTEPLMQIAPQQSQRKARLVALANYDGKNADPRGNVANASFSREKLTRRMNADSLSEDVSRLGMAGDRVLIKF